MSQDHGEPLAIRTMIRLLASDKDLKLGAGLAQKGQRVLPDVVAKSLKLGNIPLNLFPKMNKRPLRKSFDTVILPDKAPVGTVVYFTGCATNYLFEDTGFAAIGILKHMGYKIIIPKDQTCCSIPLLFHGAQDRAQKNIIQNVKALTGHHPDAILVDCSTCGEALKKEYPAYLGNQKRFQAEEIASKVTDILTFLDRHFALLKLDQNPLKIHAVTYHAPCHTKNSSGAHLIAENLLKRVPTLDYKRTADFDTCCGGGGTFFYEYPDIAKIIIDKKVANAKSLNTDFWATDCPVCRINLSGNIKQTDKCSVIHPLGLIFQGLDHTDRSN